MQLNAAAPDADAGKSVQDKPDIAKSDAPAAATDETAKADPDADDAPKGG